MTHSGQFQRFHKRVEQSPRDAENEFAVVTLFIGAEFRFGVVMDQIEFSRADSAGDAVVLVNDGSGEHHFDGEVGVVIMLEKAGSVALDGQTVPQVKALGGECGTRPDVALNFCGLIIPRAPQVPVFVAQKIRHFKSS